MNDPAGGPALLRDAEARARAVREADTDDFITLARLAGLDPVSDLRFHDWSGVSFSGCDLRGCDFTGAKLVGCDFTDAQIMNARFDLAEVAGANLRAAADWSAYVRNWRPMENRGNADRSLRPWAVFQDAPFAPELIMVPSGSCSAKLVSPSLGSGGQNWPSGDWPLAGWKQFNQPEVPERQLHVPMLLAVSCRLVTTWEFSRIGRKKNQQRGEDNPVRVKWNDAQDYIAWLNHETGIETYRLLSEAEWEYCCQIKWPAEQPFREMRYSWSYEPFPNTRAGVWLADEWHKNLWDRPDYLDTTAAAWVTRDRPVFRVLKILKNPNIPSSEKYYSVVTRARGRTTFNLAGWGSNFFRVARNLSV